jgi:Tfp pilus assembly protein PilO
MNWRPPRLDIRQAGRRIVTILGVLAAVNLLFYAFFVRPLVREYRSIGEGHEPLQKLSARKDQVEDHEQFVATVKQTEGDLETLRLAVLSTRNERMVEVQQELAALCERFGIDLTSVTFDGQLLLDEGLDRMAMNVPLEGNYRNLREFLRAVEDSDKFLIIERVALARAKEGGRPLDLSIQLATYFRAPEELMERKRAQGRRG